VIGSIGTTNPFSSKKHSILYVNIWAITKFELFQRLNTGGSELSEQEVRNYSISITERLFEERYDMELALRMFVLGNAEGDDLKGIEEVSEFLTKKVTDFTCDRFHWDEESIFFKKTFDIICESLGDNSFKKYDVAKGGYRGGFHLSAYEVLSTGVYKALKVGELSNDEIKALLIEYSKNIFTDDIFIKHSGSGAKANYRWPRFQDLIKRIFLDG